MSCAKCVKNRGMDILSEDKILYVRCGSSAHARFMDELGGTRHQDQFKNYGFNLLVSSEQIGMICPNEDNGEREMAGLKARVKCDKCRQKAGFSICGRCLVCGYQQHRPRIK